jgi:hypothetical protein
MFDRIISVDWSGAGTETTRVDLRVAVFDATEDKSFIENAPFRSRSIASWSRRDFRGWLVNQLQSKRRTLVAFDFGFSLPWGSDRAIFGVIGWREMVRGIAKKYEEYSM